MSDESQNPTSLTSTAEKAKSDRPFLELRPRVLECEFCENRRFRRSRVRFLDLFQLLVMRFPVRCLRCSQRQYQDLNLAVLAAAPRSHNPRAADDSESWQKWTKSSPETPLSTRPMSTALGTSARRLPQTAPGQRTAPPSRIPSRHNSENDIW